MLTQKRANIGILICALFFISALMGNFSQYASAIPMDDGYEENDQLSTAAEIVPDYYNDLVSSDLDYYMVYVPGDQDLEVTLYFDYLVDNMTVDLFDENGTLLLSGGYLYDGVEQAYLWATGKDQNITICVKSDFFSGVTYNMDIWEYGDWDWEAETEPNNAFNQAYELYPGYFGGLRQFDDDWYSLYIRTDAHMRVEVSYQTDMDVIYFDVYDENGIIAWSSDDHDWGFGLDFSGGPFGSWYWIRISGDSYGASYDLNVFNLNNTSDDGYENNDDRGSAAWMDINGYYTNLFLLDEDWYQIWLVNGDQISLDLYYPGYLTTMYVALYNSSGTQVAYTGDAWLDYNNTGNDAYFYIRVWASTYEGIYYELGLFLGSDDDWAEENDVQTEAYWLDYGYRTNGFIQIDEDWFQMGNIQSGNTLYVEMFYDTSMTDLYLDLYDSTGNPHGYTISSYSDRKVLSWTAGGDYSSVFLRVSGPNNADWYDLNVYYDIGGGNQDDWFEENDYPEQHTWLNVPGEWFGLKQYDDDFYRFYGNSGDHIDIDLNCDSYSDIYVEEWQVGSNTFIQSDGSTEDGHLHMIIDVGDYGQDFMIVVRGNNAGSWYDLKIAVNGDTQPSDNDWVNVDPSDVFVYDINIEFDDDGGARGPESYNGTLKLEVKNIHTEPGQLWLELGFSWDGIPLEFTGQFPDRLYYQIYSDGNIGENGSYFGIFPVILGNAFVLDAATMDFGPDFSWNITGDHTLEAEHTSGTPWWWGEATFDSDWVLDHLTFDMELRDESDNMYGKMHLTASRVDSNHTDDTSNDDTSSDDSSSDDDSNPFGSFDMSSIPGYGGWSLAFSGIGLTGLLAVLIKKKRR